MNEYVPYMPKGLFKEIMQGFTIEMASAYPEVNQAYEAMAKFLGQPRDRILMTQGADMAIKISLETFCDPGDKVLTISPTFAMYGIHTALLNCELVQVMCEGDCKVKLEKLLDEIRTGIRAVVLANPNGVTGYEFSINEVRKICEQADKNNIVVIMDETYADFGSINSSCLIDEFSNLVIVRSFSKNIGFAGLRVGYIITNEEVAGMIEKMKPMMELNALAVKAVLALCNHPDYLKKAVKAITSARHRFGQQMEKLGFPTIERQGNFVLIDFKDKKEKISETLSANNIEFKALPTPVDKYIRITVGTKKVMDYTAKVIKDCK